MSIGNILPFVLIFITAAIAIGLGSDVLQEIEETQDNDEARLVNNESLTWAGNNTAIGFAQVSVVGDSVVLYNNGSKVNKGNNYTVTASAITITNYSNVPEWVTSTLNVTYDYTIGSSARNATGKGLTAQNTFAKWLPTIALVIVIAIVLGILIVYLANRFGPGMGGV